MPLASCGKSRNRLCRASLGCRLLCDVHLVGRQQHPGNPGIFIREGHGRLVLAATVHEASEPRATAIRLEPEPAQRRAGTMDEEGPEVHVPAFTDPKPPWRAARGMLPRHQADPRRKLAPFLNALALLTAATRAVAVSGPIPGIVMRRWQTGCAAPIASIFAV